MPNNRRLTMRAVRSANCCDDLITNRGRKKRSADNRQIGVRNGSSLTSLGRFFYKRHQSYKQLPKYSSYEKNSSPSSARDRCRFNNNSSTHFCPRRTGRPLRGGQGNQHDLQIHSQWNEKYLRGCAKRPYRGSL